MDAVLDGPRTERSKYAPRIETVMIPTDKIRDLIGKGGATIRGIVEQTGAKIDVDDTGKVSVASSDAEGLKKALAIIGNLTAVPEIGKTYLGKVVRLAEFGAFVELFPGTDGLLHISEIAEHRVKEVKDELREGDQVMVKVLAIEGNRIKLSRKALIKEQKAKLGQSAAPQAEEAEIAAAEIGARPAPAPARPRHEFDERQPSSNQSTILIEGGDDFDERAGRGVRRDERAELQSRGWSTSCSLRRPAVRRWRAARVEAPVQAPTIGAGVGGVDADPAADKVNANEDEVARRWNKEGPDNLSGSSCLRAIVSATGYSAVLQSLLAVWGPERTLRGSGLRMVLRAIFFGGVLARVHAKVGCDAQGFGIGCVVRKDGDADAGPDPDFLVAEGQRLFKKLHQGLDQRAWRPRGSWALRE